MNEKQAVKKILLFVLVLALFAGYLSALEVAESEITGAAEGATIEFINYSGPHAVINTAEEIRGIGAELGTALRTAPTAGTPARYWIQHIVDASVATGFDADILTLGPGAGVDHIDNIRRILSAYLTAAYGYSDRDSRLLAEFITVYNAVYRGRMEMFRGRYKPAVVAALDPARAGLALRYDEWPGRTQIVIPLSDSRFSGTLSTVSTTAITDPAVVEQLREDPDRAIDSRKDMVELKEREAEEAQQRAADAQRQAAQAAEREAATAREADAARRAAEQAQRDAAAAREEAAARPDDQAARQAAAQAEQDAAAAREEAARAAAERDAAREETAARREEAEAEQTLADTKQQEAIADRREVASDQQEVIAEQRAEAQRQAADALATAQPATALRVLDERTLLADLVIVDLNTGKIIKTSVLNTIRGRTIADTGRFFVAIAGTKTGSGAVRLVQIDPATLEVLKQGADNIAEASMLVVSGPDVYAVLETGDGFVLGRFDQGLEVKARSAIKVSAWTAITVTPKGILVQAVDGTIRLLRSSDLTAL